MTARNNQGERQAPGRITPEQLKAPVPTVRPPQRPGPAEGRAPEILSEADPAEVREDEDIAEIQMIKGETGGAPNRGPRHPLPPAEPAASPGSGHRASPHTDRVLTGGSAGAGRVPRDSVFAFRRRQSVQPVMSSRRRQSFLGAAVMAPHPGPPPPPLETEPPDWLISIARVHGGTSRHAPRRLRERTGFQTVYRLSRPDRWQDIAIVTLEATPGDRTGMDALRALRDLEVHTWQAILEDIATMRHDLLPPTSGVSPGETHEIRELLLPPPSRDDTWVFPTEEGPPGLVRPYLPWPTLADTGISALADLEAPLRALLDRLEALGSREEPPFPPGGGWAGNVVQPEVVLRELARWRAGETESGPDRLTGHHFMVYAPVACAAGRDPAAPAVLLPTQWRLLHRVWRTTFVVQEDPERPRGNAEDPWTG